jgi:hypothetical protein
MTREIPEGYVKMGKHLCPVCTKEHDSGEILLHKRLREIPDDKTLTGWGLCDEHKAQFDDGYIFLVGADEGKSSKAENGGIDLNGAYRTGDIAAVRRTVAEDIFNCPIPENGLLFCDAEVIIMLQGMMENAE